MVINRRINIHRIFLWKTVSHSTESNFKFKLIIDFYSSSVLFCGMIGYDTFLRTDWLRMIFNYQNEQLGCFTQKPVAQSAKHHRITKRTLRYESDGKCEAHATGVALATMSIYLRQFQKSYI